MWLVMVSISQFLMCFAQQLQTTTVAGAAKNSTSTLALLACFFASQVHYLKPKKIVEKRKLFVVSIAIVNGFTDLMKQFNYGSEIWNWKLCHLKFARHSNPMNMNLSCQMQQNFHAIFSLIWRWAFLIFLQTMQFNAMYVNGVMKRQNHTWYLSILGHHHTI